MLLIRIERKHDVTKVCLTSVLLVSGCDDAFNQSEWSQFLCAVDYKVNFSRSTRDFKPKEIQIVIVYFSFDRLL